MNLMGNLSELKALDMEINKLKETLYILMTKNNLTDEVVVECSQKLDELIFKYQKYMNFM